MPSMYLTRMHVPPLIPGFACALGDTISRLHVLAVNRHSHSRRRKRQQLTAIADIEPIYRLLQLLPVLSSANSTTRIKYSLQPSHTPSHHGNYIGNPPVQQCFHGEEGRRTSSGLRCVQHHSGLKLGASLTTCLQSAVPPGLEKSP